MSTPELEIWQGDWGLPSVDLNCLRVMAYAKFSGTPLKIKKSNNPWWSPTGELPVYRQGSAIKLTKFEDIASQFKNQNYNADFELNPKQLSDIRAYSTLLEEKLLPGLLYSWWLDSKNYIDLTRPWYAKAVPFPLNYFVPGSEQGKAKTYLLGKYGLQKHDEEMLENLVFKDSLECLTLLDNRIGSEEFFFGRSPTSLDAVVFAYLAPLLKVPFPNPVLQNHLKACNNLVRFVVRVIHRYFPSVSEVPKNVKPSASTPQTPNEEDEFPNKLKNQILSGIVAVCSMLGYAFLAGLVQIELSAGEDQDKEDEEDDSSPHFYERENEN